MKTKKLTKFFDFTLLQEYQEYDRCIERVLALLTDNNPPIEFIINYLKNAIMPIDQKIMRLYRKLANVCYFEFEEQDLVLFFKLICDYLFEGTMEYRYRKQFAK